MQTDLTSLTYSSMPLGSDKPYITKKIGEAPNSQLGLEIQRRLDDTSRIVQMLKDKPGIKYLLHEAALQQIGVGQRVKKARGQGKTLAGAVLQQIGATVGQTVKIIGSTLSQVAVNGTGTHFLKAFRTDTYLQDSDTHSAFATFFGAGGVEGAPLALEGKPITGKVSSNFGTTDVSGQKFTVTSTSELDYDGKKHTLSPGIETTLKPGELGTINLDVQGGIKKSGTREGKTVYSSGSLYDNPNYVEPEIPESMSIETAIKEGIGTSAINQDSPERIITDFRLEKGNTYTFNYNDTNIKRETRVNLGDQGKKKLSTFYTNYSEVDVLAIDSLNALDVKKERVDGKAEARDFAKFFFEIITPDGSKFLHFRAFIDSLDNGYSADWQGKKYIGRAENFYTYGGFDSDINVSFKIAAATRSEMKPLYKKVVYLASATAPTYGAKGFMRGTLVRMTVGSYISNIPGVITSVKYTVDTGSPWEIGMQNPETGNDDDVQELPMVLSCSISFKPIYDFTPQTGLYHYMTNPEPLSGASPFFTKGQEI